MHFFRSPSLAMLQLAVRQDDDAQPPSLRVGGVQQCSGQVPTAGNRAPVKLFSTNSQLLFHSEV